MRVAPDLRALNLVYDKIVIGKLTIYSVSYQNQMLVSTKSNVKQSPRIFNYSSLFIIWITNNIVHR